MHRNNSVIKHLHEDRWIVTLQSQKYPPKTIVEEMSFERDYKNRKMIFECKILCTYDIAPYIWYVVKFAFKNVP